MANRMVYCTLATVDRRGRPRSRMVHTLVGVDNGSSLVGWVGQHRHADEACSPWERTPFVSCTYWDGVAGVRRAPQSATPSCCSTTPAGGRAGSGSGPCHLHSVTTLRSCRSGRTARRHPTWGVLRLEPWHLRVFPGEFARSGGTGAASARGGTPGTARGQDSDLSSGISSGTLHQPAVDRGGRRARRFVPASNRDPRRGLGVLGRGRRRPRNGTMVEYDALPRVGRGSALAHVGMFPGAIVNSPPGHVSDDRRSPQSTSSADSTPRAARPTAWRSRSPNCGVDRCSARSTGSRRVLRRGRATGGRRAAPPRAGIAGTVAGNRPDDHLGRGVAHRSAGIGRPPARRA